MKTGIELISEERKRQIEKEGWSLKHDAKHTDGSLALVAALYATPEPLYQVHIDVMTQVLKWVDPWPWWDKIFEPGIGYRKNRAWDKRKKHDRVTRLKIAGALIAAEIDRIQAEEQLTQPDKE